MSEHEDAEYRRAFDRSEKLTHALGFQRLYHNESGALVCWEASTTCSWWGVVQTRRRWPEPEECDCGLIKNPDGTYSYLAFELQI